MVRIHKRAGADFGHDAARMPKYARRYILDEYLASSTTSITPAPISRSLLYRRFLIFASTILDDFWWLLP